MAGVFKADGTRVTKAGFPSVAYTADPERVVSEDLHVSRPYGRFDPKPEGSIRTLLVKSGARMRQSEIDRLFKPATVTGVSPTSIAAVGGTVVTVTGTDLDGVTAVNFGGTAGTALTVLSATELRVTSPAKAAGTYALEVVDDSGTVAAGNVTAA